MRAGRSSTAYDQIAFGEQIVNAYFEVGEGDQHVGHVTADAVMTPQQTVERVLSREVFGTKVFDRRIAALVPARLDPIAHQSLVFFAQPGNSTREAKSRELGEVRGLDSPKVLRLEYLPKHVLQDAAVLVVLDFLRGVDANLGLELDR